MKASALTDARHPLDPLGPVVGLYVWPYALRFFHWGMVISIVVLSATGYFIQNPFVLLEARGAYVMGWCRFVHEVFGMFFISLFVLRLYLFIGGNRWVRWRQYVPLRKEQFIEMLHVMLFYSFIRKTPITKIGHNSLAAFSYLGIYFLAMVEIVTGLVMFSWLVDIPLLTLMVGWLPRLLSLQDQRLIHYLSMFIFFAFAIFHVHICTAISREEKRGLMDSIFIGYKVIPAQDVKAEEEKALSGEG